MGAAILLASCGEAQTTSETPSAAVATAASQDAPAQEKNNQYILTLYALDDCEPCNEIKAAWPTLASELAKSHPQLTSNLVICDIPENEAACDEDPMISAYPSILLQFPSGKRIEFADYYSTSNIKDFVVQQVK